MIIIAYYPHFKKIIIQQNNKILYKFYDIEWGNRSKIFRLSNDQECIDFINNLSLYIKSLSHDLLDIMFSKFIIYDLVIAVSASNHSISYYLIQKLKKEMPIIQIKNNTQFITNLIAHYYYNIYLLQLLIDVPLNITLFVVLCKFNLPNEIIQMILFQYKPKKYLM